VRSSPVPSVATAPQLEDRTEALACVLVVSTMIHPEPARMRGSEKIFLVSYAPETRERSFGVFPP
jgi:hypothetical protein